MKHAFSLTLIEVLFVFLAFNYLSHAFLLPSPWMITQNSTILDEIFNSTAANLTAPGRKCKPKIYGHELSLGSCLNAWEKMPHDRSSNIYGLRRDIAAGARFDVGLPKRFLSDDGLCAIDIVAKRDSERELRAGDSAKNIEVAQAAMVLIDQCVLNAGHGGYYNGFSSGNLLTVIVRRYEPEAVCDDTPQLAPYPQFCERVLQTMPARTQLDVFVLPTDHRPAGRYSSLPKIFEFRKCHYLYRKIPTITSH